MKILKITSVIFLFLLTTFILYYIFIFNKCSNILPFITAYECRKISIFYEEEKDIALRYGCDNEKLFKNTNINYETLLCYSRFYFNDVFKYTNGLGLMSCNRINDQEAYKDILLDTNGIDSKGFKIFENTIKSLKDDCLKSNLKSEKTTESKIKAIYSLNPSNCDTLREGLVDNCKKRIELEKTIFKFSRSGDFSICDNIKNDESNRLRCLKYANQYIGMFEVINSNKGECNFSNESDNHFCNNLVQNKIKYKDAILSLNKKSCLTIDNYQIEGLCNVRLDHILDIINNKNKEGCSNISYFKEINDMCISKTN